MASKRTKPCALCGTLYEYCNTCSSDMDKPIWMNTFCSEECLKTFEILSTYAHGGMSKEDAKKILSIYNSEKHKGYKGSIAKTYDEIMKEDVPVQEDIEKQDKIVETVKKDLAEETAKAVIKDMTKETKKFYPKSVTHKKG